MKSLENTPILFGLNVLISNITSNLKFFLVSLLALGFTQELIIQGVIL